MITGQPSEGAFPVSCNLEWHGGVHLTAPVHNNQTEPVRAIADGTVIYKRLPTPRSNDPAHPLAYLGWTDNGCVVIRHDTAIGDGAQAAAVSFLSIYMHLSQITPAVKLNKRIYRKDAIGEAGQIEGGTQRRIHFEIVCNDANLRKLVGRSSGDLDLSKHGRSDAVYGELYFHLPAGTPVFSEKPLAHSASALRQPPKPQPSAPWPAPVALAPVYITTEAIAVGLHYAAGDGPLNQRGDAVLTSYRLSKTRLGESIGQSLREAEAEYNLYQDATAISKAYSARQLPTPAPSAVFELLRFGRIINTAHETLTPADVPHWRRVNLAHGAGTVTGWVNLNAAPVTKFSDADCPHWRGWTLVNDDAANHDSRCDSKLIRQWLDMNHDGKLDPLEALVSLSEASVQIKLQGTVCQLPTEWDAGLIEQRWGWVKVKSDDNPMPMSDKDFAAFAAHVAALAIDSAEVRQARWHWQPGRFIHHFRRCGWLSTTELHRTMPNADIKNVDRFANAFNKVVAKYLNSDQVRKSHFIGQISHETGDLSGPMVERGNSPGSRLYETDEHYYRGPDDYSYMRPALGYERIHNTLGNEFSPNGTGDGIKFRGRGSLQITGRANYSVYWIYRGWIASSSFDEKWWSKQGWWNVPRNALIRPAMISNPQRISARASGNEYNPIDVGGWFWAKNNINKTCQVENSFLPLSNASNAVSTIINKYDTPTFQSRKNKTEKAKKILSDGI